MMLNRMNIHDICKIEFMSRYINVNLLCFMQLMVLNIKKSYSVGVIFQYLKYLVYCLHFTISCCIMIINKISIKHDCKILDYQSVELKSR